MRIQFKVPTLNVNNTFFDLPLIIEKFFINFFLLKIFLVPLCDKCISCICLAISNCDKSWKCEGDVCGRFRITEGYWTDAGQLTIPGDDSTSGQCDFSDICSYFNQTNIYKNH